ncbi:MAG TPA: 2-phosphosulfolactate phosphatase [Gemmatimonadaceae bacterium]|jgi:2-phosphosulfolactate phosphatase|nr:2-phosphosulfolactate phosphatase [Gemmatimonadaceae bacterium]
MRIDVLFGPSMLSPAAVTGRVVAVIDVLRASTTIATALANGARKVVPLESADAVITRAKQFERADVRTAGEQKMQPIPGFDLGNSPREMTREAVDGKTVLFTTTNGTATLLAVQGARDVAIASYVNVAAVTSLLRTAARGGTDISIVCAGRDRQLSLEDAACAGRYVRLVTKQIDGAELGDGAFACTVLDRRYGDRLDKLFADSEHGRALAGAGFGEDLVACAAVNAHPVIPIYQDRQITLLGPDRER